MTATLLYHIIKQVRYLHKSNVCVFAYMNVCALTSGCWHSSDLTGHCMSWSKDSHMIHTSTDIEDPLDSMVCHLW